MAEALHCQESSFINKMVDDAGAVTFTLDRWVDSEQGDVRMISASGEFAAVAANIQRTETHESLIRVAVNPDSAIAELNSLRNILV